MVPLTVRIEPSLLRVLHDVLLKCPHIGADESKSKYESFRVRCRKGTIVAYTSGKVVASGATCEALLMESIFSMGEKKDRADIVVGSDEAGKGEWLGPLVVAAVAISPIQTTHLRAHGVMDSKDLTLERIEELAPEIRNQSIGSHVVLLSPEAFNQKFDELHEEGKNLNDLLAWAHATAISHVYKGIRRSSGPKLQIVVDEFARAKAKARLERVMDLSTVELVQRHAAEDEIAVAAASILARAAREKWIENASKKLGINLYSISIEKARVHSQRLKFAKASYIRPK